MKEQLDQVQEGLTRLCQDATLELELRLQLLELIELRTLGWETSESMEKFYTDKFKEVREKRDGEDSPRRPMTEEMITTDQEEAAQEMVQVGPVKLFLSSSSREVTVAAKKQLEQFFTPASSPSAPTTSHVSTQDTTLLNQSNTRYTVPPIPSPPLHQGDAAHARQQPGVVEGSSQLGQEDSVPAKSDREAAEIGGAVSPVSVVSFEGRQSILSA